MKRVTITIAIGAMLGTLACGSSQQDPLDGVSEIVFLQRQARGGMGDIFNYADYSPGARIVKLSPPTADGELTVLCCDEQGPDFANIDINSYDLSFDAKEILFSARLSGDQRYGLFILTIDTGKVEQLPTNPNHHYVYAIFLPGDKIMYMTTENVEGDPALQFRDEYERGTTTQLGVMARDGSSNRLGARNLSHRVFPSLMSDGRVLLTQWDHLGMMNSGHLITIHPDMSTVREYFGKEGTGVTNSYYKPVEIAPGRAIAIGSSRNMTLQSGTILDIRAGEPYEVEVNGKTELHADRNMSERNASYQILTPQVPRGEEPSSPTIGRYYDAYPLNANAYPDLLVSWADGPVQSGVLEAAGLTADFGIYMYESKTGNRLPIWNDENYWDINPRPLAPRDAPPVIADSPKNQFSDSAVLLGSMNVYDSSLTNFEPGSIYAVRVIEGFSVEEGVPNDFGLTEHEGAVLLGNAIVQEDGSWAALVPANVPVHQQAIDKFGMALETEPVWISGAPGESRFCGGCHEDRAKTTVIQPGITQAVAIGPNDLRSDLSRDQRKSTDFSMNSIMGVPWNQALQPIFDAKCVSCHEGTPGPANPSYTIMDPETGASQTITFDLRGIEVSYGIGDSMMSGYTASHLSLLGPDMMDLEDAGLVVVGEMPIYVEPLSARDSVLLQKLNPPQLFPVVDMNTRAFTGATHPADVGGPALTAEEYYRLILMADMGGQYYSRENAPGSTY